MVQIKSTTLRFARFDGKNQKGGTKYAYNTLTSIDPDISDETVLSLIGLYDKLQDRPAGIADKSVVSTYKAEIEEEDEEDDE